jgi:hypothetical protein
VSENAGPLLTTQVHQALLAARAAGTLTIACSLDLGRSTTAVEVGAAGWVWDGRQFPFLHACKDRTIYYWAGAAFQPVACFSTSLIKLVPTQWGSPTFEIDGIKMLPTARVSPYEDARRKVGLIQPRGKLILDTCGGLGYFAAWCLRGHATQIHSYEKNSDVIWLRSLNPWSPDSPWSREPGSALTLTKGDIAERVTTLPTESVDAILHDPPRFAIAGELYSRTFYDHLARVLKRKGKLFHYTGTPNKHARGRNLQNEVAIRLRRAGFAADLTGDGLLAVKTRRT